MQFALNFFFKQHTGVIVEKFYSSGGIYSILFETPLIKSHTNIEYLLRDIYWNLMLNYVYATSWVF